MTQPQPDNTAASSNARKPLAMDSLSIPLRSLFAVLDNFPLPSLLHDADAVCHANQAAAQLWGVEDMLQLQGQPLEAILPQVVPPRNTTEPAQANGPPTRHLKRHDGRMVDVALQQSLIEMDDREFVHVVISPLDQQRLELPNLEASQPSRSAAYLRAFGECSPDIMLLISRDGRIEYLNRTSGRPPVDLFIGMNIFTLLKEQEPGLSRLKACIERVEKEGKSDQCVASLDNRAGESRTLELRIAPVVEQGQTAAFAINGRDITSQHPVAPGSANQPLTRSGGRDGEHLRLLSFDGSKVAAQAADDTTTLVKALQRTYDELQHVTASVSAGLWSLRVSRDGHWSDLYRSTVMETIVGHSFESLEHSAKSWLEIVHPEDQSSVLETLHRLLRCAPTHDETEYRIILPDGTTKWVRSSTNAQRTPDGSIRLDGVLTDITEQKAIEEAFWKSDEQVRRHQEELAHAGRLSTLGELVASIAHEINQPLHAIANYAGACQNALTNPSSKSLDQIARWAQEIGTQSRRAGEIITRLGDFVRKTPPHRTALSINDLVIDSLDLLRFEARRHQIRIGIELAPPGARILADRVQIQQVLVNLIRNAFDALACVPVAKRRVAISIESLAERMIVHVEDVGKGLTEDEHAMLFQPFFTTKEHGMGMGLAISRSIIESHGGQLWATANAGAGTTFHFRLPVHQTQ